MKKIGRYEIVEELGRGATGVVYKASDPTIGRLVALKAVSLTPSEEEGLPSASEIFMREARAAGRLSHPGIVTIHDALEDARTESGYIVMEFVPGRTLEGALISGPPLTAEQSLDVIRQLAEALDYAHRQQVIHRDLKPANILLTEDGRAKITDFGIAKIMEYGAAHRTAAVMGTPSYMSPEQVTGSDVDARSDLFSLGIISYLLFTGQKPFVGDTAAVMFKIAYEDPVSPSQVNPKLSSDHDYVVLRCLAKDRNKRYATAREFLDDLDDVQHVRPPRSKASFPTQELRTAEPTVVARKVEVPPPVATPAPAAGAVPAPQEKKGKSMRGSAAAVAGTIGLVMLLGLGVWVSRHRRAASPPSGVAATTPNGAAAGTTPLPASSSSDVPPAAAAPAPPKQEVAQTSKATAPETPPAAPGANTKRPPARRVGGSAGHTVELVCHHQLKEGTIRISSGSETISEWPLKGTKKGGFLGLKGGYAGTLSRSLKIPPGTRELSVHVVSADGSLDLSQTISATPPRNASPILQVSVSAEHVTLRWRPASHSTPTP